MAAPETSAPTRTGLGHIYTKPEEQFAGSAMTKAPSNLTFTIRDNTGTLYDTAASIMNLARD